MRPILVLLGEDDAQDLSHRLVVLEREEELDRPLAHIARAPGGAAVLIQAVWHREVNHRVVREPWKQAVQRRNLRPVAGDADAARHPLPILTGGGQQRLVLDSALVPGRQSLGLADARRGTDHRKAELAWVGRERSARYAPERPSIAVQQLVAPDRLDRPCTLVATAAGEAGMRMTVSSPQLRSNRRQLHGRSGRNVPVTHEGLAVIQRHFSREVGP
jgi:hypothetical protein